MRLSLPSFPLHLLKKGDKAGGWGRGPRLGLTGLPGPSHYQCGHLTRDALTSTGCLCPGHAGFLAMHCSPCSPVTTPSQRATCGSEGEEEKENWGSWLGTPFPDFSPGCWRSSLPLPSPAPHLASSGSNPRPSRTAVRPPPVVCVPQSARAAPVAHGPCGRPPLHG